MGSDDGDVNVTSRIHESTVHGGVVQAGIANFHPPQPPPYRRALWIGLLVLAVLVGLGSGLLLVRGRQQDANLGQDGRSSAPPASLAPLAPSFPTPTPTPTSEELFASVQWHGRLTLGAEARSGTTNSGYELDLMPPRSADGGDLSVHCAEKCDANKVSGKTVIPWTGSEEPSREDCVRQLNTPPGGQSMTVRAGSMACFGTAQMRVGYFTVLSAGGDGPIALDVTVWGLPPSVLEYHP
ncbi:MULTISPECIES: hypothetical protein [Streptomycetaceae]|uniref:hypothetical protein n=1 Tax=Streptomycetaceae TaxID=2062 RepID=UPI000963DC4D|nr:hypothetical protein [Streptomyces sp. CB02056]OKI05551.1 hypothetical protein AMK13_19500 [Streptomyces sp. CB02056]